MAEGTAIGEGEQVHPKVCRGKLAVSLRSSCYIVVTFGWSRLVWTVKRTRFEDRWKVASPSDLFSAGDLELTLVGFTYAKVAGDEVTAADKVASDSRGFSGARGRQTTAVVSVRSSVVAVHRSTPKSAEFVSRKC